MLRAIFWKEWRQQSPFLFAIVILIPLLVGLFRWSVGTAYREPVSIQEVAAIAAAGIALIQAIVTGSLLFAAEVEGNTLDYLDACSAQRSRIWRAKMASGLAVAMPALLLPALVDGVRGILTTVVATGILLLAAAASAFVRTTFRAIGIVVPLLIVVGVVLARLTYDRSFQYLAFRYGSPVAFLSLLFVAVIVFASWRWFCRPDRGRTADGSRTLLARLPPSWMTAALWLSFVRQWPIWLTLGITYAVYCVFFPDLLHTYLFDSFFLVAPAMLLAIGCLFGWNVFALEQAGAEWFLGDQRLPRTRLWLTKVGVGLAATALVSCWFAYVLYWQRDYNGWPISPLALGFLGFAVAQFFGMHARPMPVAICLTLIVAASIGAAWYAPLFGGAAVWPLVVVTLVFLAGTRFELRRWAAGRMDGPAHWIRFGVVVLGCFAWTGWVLWQRTAEVPDVGEPFVAVESPTETPVERERNLRLSEPARSAANLYHSLLSLEQTSWTDTMPMRWHEPGIELMENPPSTDLPTTIFALGAPDEGRKEFARLVAALFKSGWSKTLVEDLANGPRRIPALGSRELYDTAHHLDDAAKSYCLKTALLLAEGKTDAALDEYAMALKVLRRRVLFGGHTTGSIGAWDGIGLEDDLLDAAEMMLRRYGHDPAFCRGLLALIDRHAEEMPTFSDLVKACYAMHNPRPAPSTDWFQHAGPLAVLFDSPIETIRDDRLQRAFCRGLLKAAEEKTLLTKPWQFDRYDHVWPARYMVLGAPERSLDEWMRILSHQSLYEVQMFRTFLGFGYFAWTASRRDAIRLACAAALYKHDHGRDLNSLAELSPEYFPALPKSPYSECPFVLRRSGGETWKLFRLEQEVELPIVRTIAPGTPVIEMPGLPKLKIAVPAIKAS
jgi:hypothetical protein